MLPFLVNVTQALIWKPATTTREQTDHVAHARSQPLRLEVEPEKHHTGTAAGELVDAVDARVVIAKVN